MSFSNDHRLLKKQSQKSINTRTASCSVPFDIPPLKKKLVSKSKVCIAHWINIKMSTSEILNCEVMNFLYDFHIRY